MTGADPMRLIGSGFLARHLRPLADAYPGVTVLAAGVPRHPLPDAEHEREARLVADTLRDCVRDGRQLVFFSTVSMYGGPGCQGREDDPVEPALPYGRHKLDLEGMIRDCGVPYLILRLGYVLGPGEPEFRLVPAIIRQLRAGRVTVQPGARRDIVHVEDWMTVVDRLLATGVTDEVVNVASGDCAEIAAVIDVLERHLGVTAERVLLDSTVSHCPSIAKLRTLVPEVTALGFGPGYHRVALARYLSSLRATG
ncbi:NAD-dependent epimerase/dehydratase [Micromonospora sp. L5]|uniref:NAD(P)-dependent oxidoreductase n=2 Tax=Micromonosporaceae TaxID=28056 RepID=A0A1C6TPP6_9ACTN|nr:MULTISPECIES: NAD(P)-dependent oxidoreductase [Micromonospora]ADL47539.1 NAD-dependent epimerase/dehydratase [Micromonospora aurantiaca ATCC 27029]ADU09882.1 NAD-dependent epimerase/dehydratase [Micromonospora sp. L5]OHX01519.1 epimerase [Micromonospora sp. WMMB235]AXH93418.1 NAD(P)-dependent oxidoreductase [Micromonospora aurantiaca]KAB1116491.1 NAD(P)-dependent oxidoreductase [Micromonospora aurantiaca]